MTSTTFPIQERISPIQMLLLIQLKHGSKYGYEMLKNIRDGFEGVWEPKTGTIYPALRSLESKGLVKTEKRDETDYYFLTDLGEEHLLELNATSLRRIEFTFRFMSFLSNWVHEDMLPTIVEIIESIAREDQIVFPHLLDKLDDETKRKVYNNLVKISNRRKKAFEEIFGVES
jgi:DNA-binding PadR family transcriptional regulator